MDKGGQRGARRCRRILLVVRRIALALLSCLLLALPAVAVAAPTVYDAVNECRAGGVPERACRSAGQLVWGAAAGCRKTVGLAAPDSCESIDGRRITPSEIQEYQDSFVHRALTLQRGLDDAAPLREQQIVHTHNTFNSSSYFSTLTNQDANQVYSITDQLDMDVRFLELDLHWVPSPFGNAATGGNWVTLCHGNSAYVPGVHLGCTWDRPLQDGLSEISTWLDQHPGEFVYLYLENQLGGGATAHTVAAQLLEAAFPGTQIYRPPAGTPCADMPIDSSRADFRAAGARVLLVGNCGTGDGLGTPWGGVVHERGAAWNEGGSAPYDAADCAADRAAMQSGTSFRRWFGDSTWLTAMVSGSTDIVAADSARMVACGVNIIGFDQLMPDDGKLESMVWSWREIPSATSTDECAAQDAAGRFVGRGCELDRHYACVSPAGEWAVTAASGPWDDAAAACAAEFPGSSFSVPVNGLRNDLLLAAHQVATIEDAWVDYRRIDGVWTPETI